MAEIEEDQIFPVPLFRSYKEENRRKLIHRAAQGDLLACFYLAHFLEDFKIKGLPQNYTLPGLRKKLLGMPPPDSSHDDKTYNSVGHVAYRLNLHQIARLWWAQSKDPVFRDVAMAMTMRDALKRERLLEIVFNNEDDRVASTALYLLAISAPDLPRDQVHGFLRESGERGFHEAFNQLGSCLLNDEREDEALAIWRSVSSNPLIPRDIRVDSLENICRLFQRHRDTSQLQTETIRELIALDADSGNQLLCDCSYLWSETLKPDLLAIDPLFQVHFAEIVKRRDPSRHHECDSIILQDNFRQALIDSLQL